MATANGLAINGFAPVRDKFLVFGSPAIGDEEVDEVVHTLRSGWIGMGPKTIKFEKSFAEYIGSQNAIAVNSCTAGLELALEVGGIGIGDEVITTPMSFVATANVIVHRGATPIFVDIDPVSQNINAKEIEAAITTRTKAIIPVHMAGRPCNMDEIMRVAENNGLLVIEDAAHATEAKFGDRKCGTIGHFGVYSFYVTKNLTTAEGGMVITNDPAHADRLRILRLHGISKDAWRRYSSEGFSPYDAQFAGYKYNMTDIQASMGIHQLNRLEDNLKIRERLWQRYNDLFTNLPEIHLPREDTGIRHARHLYTILIKRELLRVDRMAIVNALEAENIGTGIHFIAIHLHSFYRNKYGFRRGSFPNAEFVSDRTISIPLSTNLTESDIDDVAEAVHKVISYYRI